MPPHKFAVGQIVHYVRKPGDPQGLAGTYKITRLLPGEDGERTYHVRSTRDDHVRVLPESQIGFDPGPA